MLTADSFGEEIAWTSVELIRKEQDPVSNPESSRNGDCREALETPNTDAYSLLGDRKYHEQLETQELGADLQFGMTF